MRTRLREVRIGRGLTLQQVADRCLPSTTPQTIGRIETGARGLTVPWLERIARALDVEPSALVGSEQERELTLLALLDGESGRAPPAPAVVMPPQPESAMSAIRIEASLGDYRSGDEVWVRRLAPPEFARAINRDVLVPRPEGRFLFGRLLGREAERLLLLPFGGRARQLVISDPPWAGLAERLIRVL